jgi:hypothetical protein
VTSLQSNLVLLATRERRRRATRAATYAPKQSGACGFAGAQVEFLPTLIVWNQYWCVESRHKHVSGERNPNPKFE